MNHIPRLRFYRFVLIVHKIWVEMFPDIFGLIIRVQSRYLNSIWYMLLIIYLQHWFCYLIHSSDLQTHRRGQKSGFWNFYAGRMMGNSSVKTNAENLNALAPDPLLSSFFFSKPNPETKNDHSENSCSFDDLSSISETKRYSQTNWLVIWLTMGPECLFLFSLSWLICRHFLILA